MSDLHSGHDGVRDSCTTVESEGPPLNQPLPRGDAPRLRHDALLYASTDEYVATALDFLREGLDAGDAVVVAHTRRGLSTVRQALGADAAHVTFVDVGAAYTRPARTLATYHGVYADRLRTASAVRAVADVQVGPDAGETDTWLSYEAAFNRSFEHLPAWVLCSYDTGRLPAPVVDAVWRTHVEVVTDDGWTRSPRYEDPAALLHAVTPRPPTLPDLPPLAVHPDGRDLKEHLAAALVAADVPEGKAFEMLLVVDEVLANARQHGGGLVAVRAGRAGGRFVCEVVDRGPGFDDPLAGYRAPRAGVGAGLWIARQLTWSVDFLHGPDGFTTRLTL
jgi:anti-sigma regulatory factor (Ser/Thr protein kinase)